MLDALNKPDEEPKNNVEPTNSEPCVIVDKNQVEENLLTLLEALYGEERSLLAEKAQLLNMEETLAQRIKGEIEAKRQRIDALKNEIPDLKQRCENLAKALDIQVQK
jgi:seryl-tRNA synthetase